MLETISKGFQKAFNQFRSQTVLTEENIKEAVNELRLSLLEADVEYNVVKDFIKNIQEKSIGQIVKTKAGKGKSQVRVSAQDHFIRICQKELEALMGSKHSALIYDENSSINKIMLVGLQGSGKTTTAAKLTQYLIKKKSRKPLLVAADIYRPAAVKQLKVLAERISVPVFHIDASVVEICNEALKEAYRLSCDTLIIDTAGRLTVDKKMMQELIDVKKSLQPENILFVCDAMMGQDAVTTALAFHQKLTITGSIITKLDGDTRGGAALSIRKVTGQPLQFLGMGENLDQLEEFRPEGLASRILGMGDVVGLMKDFENVATKETEEDAQRMMLGKFTYTDFYKQIKMMLGMGPVDKLLEKLPMQALAPNAALDQKKIEKITVIYQSMTKKERLLLHPLDESRKQRIARGAGTNISNVNEMIKVFQQMQGLLKNIKGYTKFLDKIPGFQNFGLKDMGKEISNIQNQSKIKRNAYQPTKEQIAQARRFARKAGRRK